MDSNMIKLDYGDNKELAQLFTGKKPGDTMTIEIELVIADVQKDSAQGRITSVSADEEGGEMMGDGGMGDGDEMMGGGGSVSPSKEEPVAILVMRKKSGVK